MKQFVAILFAIVPMMALAQEQPPRQPFIEVTGTAEMEVEPNEIYLQVMLKEFEENRQKTSLEQLDKNFFSAIKEAGIDRNRVLLADAGSTLDRIRRKEKDAFREKTYEIKLTNAKELDNIVNKLEAVKVGSINITKLNHSDLPKIKLDLKVKALQAARSKAEVMIKSIGGDIGKPLMVREWDNSGPLEMMDQANVRMNAYQLAEEPAITFRKIKLSAQVQAQFEIK